MARYRISDILGAKWNGSNYRKQLDAAGWIHTFNAPFLKTPDDSVWKLDEAIEALGIEETFDYVMHGNYSIGDDKTITVRFRTAEEALWARFFFD